MVAPPDPANPSRSDPDGVGERLRQSCPEPWSPRRLLLQPRALQDASALLDRPRHLRREADLLHPSLEDLVEELCERGEPSLGEQPQPPVLPHPDQLGPSPVLCDEPLRPLAEFDGRP